MISENFVPDVVGLLMVTAEKFFETQNDDTLSPVLLLVEHAGDKIPTQYGTLGVSPALLKEERNLPFDYGVAEISRRVAASTGQGLVMGQLSRLLIDLNRSEQSAQLIPETAHGFSIPGNARVSAVERALRIDAYYKPYHDAVRSRIDRRMNASVSPHLLSIHSFTPEVGLSYASDKTKASPDIGLLFVEDSPMLQALRRSLARRPGIMSDDNFPYDLTDLEPGSLHQHGISRNLPSVAVEISIDRLHSEEDERLWAEILSEAVQDVSLAQP